ncbi:DUF6518 family protein [Lentzea albida]|uniref:Uncharacterized protein n=1 Tax=Lentzea albida TaxID=65499 RepID=A0A1H9MFH6_9PSEU|nr:DUF6518 family protein [Lentzea albida]SER22269.1 hypothetical protein SAMN04488000_1076 [Lentzea albida]
MIFALPAGVLLGVLTNLGQGVLLGSSNSLANSGAVWVVAAFVAGSWSRRPVLAGTLTQVGAVVGYYGYAELGRDGMGGLYAPSVWLALAFVAGPLFGTAGAWWRHGQAWRHWTGAGVLGAVFGMEGLWHLFVLGYRDTGFVACALAVALPLLIARSRWRALAVSAALSLVALGCLLLISAVTGL